MLRWLWEIDNLLALGARRTAWILSSLVVVVRFRWCVRAGIRLSCVVSKKAQNLVSIS